MQCEQKRNLSMSVRDTRCCRDWNSILRHATSQDFRPAPAYGHREARTPLVTTFVFAVASEQNQRMRKSKLVAAVQMLLPPGTSWPENHAALQLTDGRTVLMVVTKQHDPRLAVKLIDFVCPLTADFWVRDACGRHVIMDACYHGVHVSILLRLVKWARRSSLNVVLPMSQQDIQGLDAVELAIQGGHGKLASCLLEQRDPATHNRLLCVHPPLKVLELAIESRNEQCVRDVLANKRVVNCLQPGQTERLNLISRWTQRQTPMKRLYNIFTCVGAAVCCGITSIVHAIYKINPEETRQAVWFAVYQHQLHVPQSSAAKVDVSVEIQQMARSFLLCKVWSQISAIVLLRHHELLGKHEQASSLWERIRRWRQYRNRDWDAAASHPWMTLPSEAVLAVLSFLLPSEMQEARAVLSLVEY